MELDESLHVGELRSPEVGQQAFAVFGTAGPVTTLHGLELFYRHSLAVAQSVSLRQLRQVVRQCIP